MGASRAIPGNRRTAPAKGAPAGRLGSAPRQARPGAPLGRDDVIDLQQLAGNRAVVSRLVVARNPDDKASPDVKAKPADPPKPETYDIAWIEGLPDHVRNQIDDFASHMAAGAERDKATVANRTQFMRVMRPLFGSDSAVATHYADIKPMDNDKKYPLWAHVSTRERLQAVADDLKSKNSPMPQTDVALGLRGDHLHTPNASPGYFTHATGFAIDWRAYAAPHIKDPRLAALFETVTGGTAHFDFNMQIPDRLDVIEKMGQGTATPEESKKFLDRVESEYNRLVAGSTKFKTDLPEENLAPLRDLDSRMMAARAAVVAATKKVALAKRGKKIDVQEAAAKELADAVAARQTLNTEAKGKLKQLFEPWTKLLDKQIEAIDKIAADRGVDLTKLTGDYGFRELNAKAAAIAKNRGKLEVTAKAVLNAVLQIQRDALLLAAKIESAKAWLADPGKAALPAAASGWGSTLDAIDADIDKALASLAPTKVSLAALLPGSAVEPKPQPAVKPAAVTQAAVDKLSADAAKLPARIGIEADKLKLVAAPLADLVTAAATTKQDITDRRKYRQEKIEEYGGGKDRASIAKGTKVVTELLAQKVKWLNLKATKDALQNDVDFVFKERIQGDPGITQLLGMTPGTRGGGFLAPDAETGGEAQAKKGQWSDTHGYNLAFFKSMVSHGFELGVAWAGWSDTMHFELVEGRRLLESGGARTVVAGAALKAKEEKEAAEKAAAAKAAADKAAADKAAAPAP